MTEVDLRGFFVRRFHPPSSDQRPKPEIALNAGLIPRIHLKQPTNWKRSIEIGFGL
jgi:hypothetical protein